MTKKTLVAFLHICAPASFVLKHDSPGSTEGAAGKQVRQWKLAGNGRDGDFTFLLLVLFT